MDASIEENSDSSYELVLRDLDSGVYGIRVQAIGLDGRIMNSSVTEIRVGPNSAIDISLPFPNPSSGTIQFQLSTVEAGIVTVDLFDMLGRQVQRIHEGQLRHGDTKTLLLDTRGVPSGVYFILANDGRSSYRRGVTIN